MKQHRQITLIIKRPLTALCWMSSYRFPSVHHSSSKMFIHRTIQNEDRHIYAPQALMDFMEQSPCSEVDSCLDTLAIPRHILWNPKVHYRVHDNPPLDPIQRSQMNKVHILTTCTLRIHFSRTLPSTEVKECVELYLHSPIRLHGAMLS
jgi:hypothetical protein